MAQCKYSLGMVLAVAFMLLAPMRAHAVCSNPAAALGTMIYNEDENVPQYCDDTNWIAMAPLGGVDIQGITCDGSSSYLTRLTPWDGVQDSTKMTGSYWFRRNTDNGVNNVVMQGQSGRWHTQIISNDRVQIRAENAELDTVINMFSNSLYTDTEWHHFLWSVDLETPGSARFYIDDVDDEFVGLTEFGDQNAGNGTNDVMDLDLINWGFCVNTSFSGSHWDGDIAEFWVDFGTYIDFSVEENRRKFIQANGRPAFLGKSGQAPTGIQPDIYLSGGAAEFPNNKGSGGDLAVGSAITDAAAEPDGVGEGRGLSIVDSINNDTTNFETVEDVALYGDYLIAASAGDDKISVVDISDPTNISYVGGVGGMSAPQNVEIHGNYVYTIEFAFDADLYVIDISDPTAPFVTDVLPTTHDECIGLKQVDGNTVFASCWAGSDNVVSFDVSDPYNISQLDVWTEAPCDNPTQMARQGNVLFVSCGNGPIYSIDITNTSDLQTLDSVTDGSLVSPRDLAIKGDYLYASSRGNDTLVVINISDPSNMTYTTSIQDAANHGEPEGIFVHGNYLYVPGQTTDSLAIYDVSNPAAPALVDSIIDGTDLIAAESVVVRGHYAYIGKSTQSGPGNGVAVIDLGTRSECSDPPGAIGTLNYSLDEHGPIYCDGDHWVAMSEDTLDRGLVGHWTLDETSGTFADSSYNDNDGTDSGGVTYAASGTIANAANFDGDNDHIQLGTDDTLDLYDSFSVSAWINPASMGEMNGGTLFGGIYTRSNVGTQGFSFYTSDGGAGHRRLGVFNGSNLIETGNTALTLNAWQLVTLTVDGTTDTAKLYVNDTEEASDTLDVDSASGVAAIIGAFDTGGTDTFDGNIDDVRVYNRVLSVADITSLYKRGLDDDGLVAYWPMDELGGVTARDYAGMYDGNLVNGPTFSSAGGQIGGAVLFDNTDDYIEIGDSPDLRPTTLSISAWIYQTARNGLRDAIVSKRNTGFYDSYLLAVFNSPGRLRFCLEPNTPNDVCLDSADDALSLNQWTHVAATYDGSDVMTIYIDGVAQPTTGSQTNALEYDAYDVLIGAEDQTGTLNMHFEGYIDDVRIYDRALSAAEINKIYTDGDNNLASEDCTNPSATEGVMIYNTDETAIQYCDGANWVKLGKR